MVWILLETLRISASEVAAPNEGQQFLARHPILVAFLASELFLTLIRRLDIIKLLKRKDQRTEQEELQVRQGLLRSILWDAIIFVPASVTLFLLLVFPLVKSKLMGINSDVVLWYAAAGIAAFGFPFAVVTKFIKEVALHTLREFGQIMVKTVTKPEQDTNELDDST